MQESKPKIKNILLQLGNQLTKCWCAFYVAKSIRQAYQSNRVPSAHYFFTSTLTTCDEGILLAFSRLVLPDKDSVHIHYLLNCVEQNPDTLPGASKQQILESVREHRQKLKEIEPLIQKVKAERDERIAHLDRKYVGDPTAALRRPIIHVDEIERAMILLLGMVNTYNGYLQPSEEFRLDILQPDIEEDLDYIVSLLGKKQKRFLQDGEDNLNE